MRHATRSLLEDATGDDPSTGSTPRKRKWDVVDSWEVSGKREQVLKDWRAGEALGIAEDDDDPAAAAMPRLRHAGAGTSEPIQEEEAQLEESRVETYIEYDVPLAGDEEELEPANTIHPSHATPLPDPDLFAPSMPRTTRLPQSRRPTLGAPALSASKPPAPAPAPAPTRGSKRLASGTNIPPAGPGLAFGSGAVAGSRKRPKLQ